MKSRIPMALAALALGLAGTARGQIEQDEYETVEAEGKGRNRKEAIEVAKRKAVFDKLIELVKQNELKEFTEDRVGINDVVRDTSRFTGACQVTKAKAIRATSGGASQGKRPRGIVGYEVTVSVSVNVSRLWREFEKARRIAALRMYGDKIGVVLQEEIEGKRRKRTPNWNFIASIAVERSFMVYKFRPMPMGTIRERFQASVEGGATLKDEKFKIETVESLASLGSHIRIVGGIVLIPLPDEKGKDGVRRKAFAASWWGEVHVGGRYERKLAVEEEKENAVTASGETEEDAIDATFKAAGEDLAFTLAEKLADDLEKEEEEEEGERRDVHLVAREVPVKGFHALEGTIRSIEGILAIKRIRVGRGLFIARITTVLEASELEEALDKALGPLGYERVDSSEKKVDLRGPGK
ncbi:MAG: hypothetical protein ACYS47_18395 [Planctomycetota bacterium]